MDTSPEHQGGFKAPSNGAGKTGSGGRRGVGGREGKGSGGSNTSQQQGGPKAGNNTGKTRSGGTGGRICAEGTVSNRKQQQRPTTPPMDREEGRAPRSGECYEDDDMTLRRKRKNVSIKDVPSIGNNKSAGAGSEPQANGGQKKRKIRATSEHELDVLEPDDIVEIDSEDDYARGTSGSGADTGSAEDFARAGVEKSQSLGALVKWRAGSSGVKCTTSDCMFTALTGLVVCAQCQKQAESEVDSEWVEGRGQRCSRKNSRGWRCPYTAIAGKRSCRRHSSRTSRNKSRDSAKCCSLCGQCGHNKRTCKTTKRTGQEQASEHAAASLEDKPPAATSDSQLANFDAWSTKMSDGFEQYVGDIYVQMLQRPFVEGSAMSGSIDLNFRRFTRDGKVADLMDCDQKGDPSPGSKRKILRSFTAIRKYLISNGHDAADISKAEELCVAKKKRLKDAEGGAPKGVRGGGGGGRG